MKLADRLIQNTISLCTAIQVRDIRIGLGYTCVELSDGSMGLAATPEGNPYASCTHMEQAGNLHNLTPEELTRGLASPAPLKRAVGLACCNALNQRVKRNVFEQEAISLLEIKQDDHVVMVGHFAPLVARIRATGCRLDIVERNPAKPGITDPRQGFSLLSRCDVAIITSTAIINDSVDDLLERLQNTRSAVMLGPSTPLVPEAFTETGITQLSGAYTTHAGKVKTIVSQGGGTRLLKKHLRFVSLWVR